MVPLPKALSRSELPLVEEENDHVSVLECTTKPSAYMGLSPRS
jgi:hypothetical protein